MNGIVLFLIILCTLTMGAKCTDEEVILVDPEDKEEIEQLLQQSDCVVTDEYGVVTFVPCP